MKMERGTISLLFSEDNTIKPHPKLTMVLLLLAQGLQTQCQENLMPHLISAKSTQLRCHPNTDKIDTWFFPFSCLCIDAVAL